LCRSDRRSGGQRCERNRQAESDQMRDITTRTPSQTGLMPNAAGDALTESRRQ
jgi:hypothetical protein